MRPAWRIGSFHCSKGEPEAAWDAFVTRYRRLIFATIRHYTQDYDDGMDLFARESVKGCRRTRCAVYGSGLRIPLPVPNSQRGSSRWSATSSSTGFATGTARPRLSSLAQKLPALQRRIFELVFLEGRSHVETYELLNTREGAGLTFREFNAQLRETYRVVGKGREPLLRDLGPGPPVQLTAVDPSQPGEVAELLRRDCRKLWRSFLRRIDSRSSSTSCKRCPPNRLPGFPGTPQRKGGLANPGLSGPGRPPRLSWPRPGSGPATCSPFRGRSNSPSQVRLTISDFRIAQPFPKGIQP